MLLYIHRSCSIEAKKHIETGFTIVDLKGGGSSLLSSKIISFVKIASQICQDNYPETLGVFYIVNCGFILRAGWTIIKVFLDPKTQSKIKILGSEYEKELLTLIEAKNLPKFLGGECDCPPNGCLVERIGPWTKYFKDFPKETDSEDAPIPKGPSLLNENVVSKEYP